MGNTSLFNLSWQRYLTLLFVLFSVGFGASGIITLIAANLDYLTDLQKIYGLQALLIILFILGIYYFVRESRNLEKSALKPRATIFFFLTSVLVGGLFALIGQTYQTGADSWQLFAIWSLCQLPFLLIVPNVASALLFIATTNISFTLLQIGASFYSDMRFDPDMPFDIYTSFFSDASLFVLLNFVFLLIAERFSEKLHDQHWRILPKVLLLLTFSGLSGVGLYRVDIDNEFTFAVIHFAKMAIPALMAIYYYKNRRFDFINLVISVLTLLSGLFFFIPLFDSPGGILSLGAISFFSLVRAIHYLVGWYQTHYPERKNVSWVISLMWLSATLTGISTLCVFLFFFLGFEGSLFGMSLLVLVFAVLIDQMKPGVGQYAVLSGILFLIGYSLLAADFILESFTLFYGFIFSLAVLGGYALLNHRIFRTLLVLQILAVWEIGLFNDYLEYQSLSIIFHFSVILIGLALFYVISSAKDEINEKLQPAAWGCLLFAIGYLVFKDYRHFYLSTFTMAEALPEVNSASDFFRIMSGGIWENLYINLSSAVYLIICALPLIIYFLMQRNYGKSGKESLLISVALLFFILGFISSQAILFLVALLFFAYGLKNRTFFIFLIALLVSQLSVFYYMLSIPLMYKAILLLSFALIFSLVACFLYQRYKLLHQNQVESAVKNDGVLGWKPVALCCVTLFMLSGANYKVHQFEDVLANGKPVILKIAPVDPRSLMQGDYMALDYAILDEVRKHQDLLRVGDDKAWHQSAYVLVNLDEHNVAQYCDMQQQIPVEFKNCAKNIYLPIRHKYWMPELPSQDYFFAEGKGEYYAQAEYAEYRFKDGTLLLARLLDKNLKAL